MKIYFYLFAFIQRQLHTNTHIYVSWTKIGSFCVLLNIIKFDAMIYIIFFYSFTSSSRLLKVSNIRKKNERSTQL
jgi:hypothetical protein